MKRTYLNLITVLMLSAGTQVQALSLDQMNPANYMPKVSMPEMPQVSMPTINWSAWNPMRYFKKQNQYYNPVDRLEYFEGKLASRRKDLAAEKQRKAGIATGLRSNAVLQNAVTRAQITCSKEDASYAECDKALAAIEQASNDARRYVREIENVDAQVAVIEKDIVYFNKKVTDLKPLADRKRMSEGAVADKQQTEEHKKAQVAAREAQLRREEAQKMEQTVKMEQALDEAALASAREKKNTFFGMSKPEMPKWIQSAREAVSNATSTLKQDWNARRQYGDYSVTTNDSITRAGLGTAVIGTALAARKFSALRSARLWNQAYGMNALMPRTRVMKLGDSATLLLQKAGAQIKGDY